MAYVGTFRARGDADDTLEYIDIHADDALNDESFEKEPQASRNPSRVPTGARGAPGSHANLAGAVGRGRGAGVGRGIGSGASVRPAIAAAGPVHASTTPTGAARQSSGRAGTARQATQGPRLGEPPQAPGTPPRATKPKKSAPPQKDVPPPPGGWPPPPPEGWANNPRRRTPRVFSALQDPAHGAPQSGLQPGGLSAPGHPASIYPGGYGGMPSRMGYSHGAPSGPGSDLLAMLNHANSRIAFLEQQIAEAEETIVQYEKKVAELEAVKTKKKRGGRKKRNKNPNKPGDASESSDEDQSDDANQPKELTGKKKEVKRCARAYTLNNYPWPNTAAMMYPYCPDIDPLDPLQRYGGTLSHVPIVEALAADLYKFFPKHVLRHITDDWTQKLIKKTQNQFKSHLLEKVRTSAHIIFRHIKDFEENIKYYRGVDRYPPIVFLTGFVDRKRYLFCDPSLDKTLRIMCHGRTALVDGHVVRDNTNSAKWRLTHTTYNMIAYAAVVVLYLVSGKSAFIRGDWEDTYQEYYRKLLDSQHSRATTELLERLNDYIFGANAKVSLKDLKDPVRDHGWARLRDDDSDEEEHQARLSTARASRRHGSSPLAAHEQSDDPVRQVLFREELDSMRQQDSFLQDGPVFQDNYDIVPQGAISLTDSDDEDGFIVHHGTPRLVLGHNDTQAAVDWPHEDDYYPVGLALHESPILDKNGRFRVRFAETPGDETDAGHQGDQEQADNPGATSGEDRGAEMDSEDDEVPAIWPHAVISSTNAHVARLSANTPPQTSNAPSFSNALSFTTPQACSTPAAFINFGPSDFVPGEPSPFAPLRDTAVRSTKPPSKAKPSKSAAAAGKRPSAKSATPKQAPTAKAPKSTTAPLPNSPFLLPSTQRRRPAAQLAHPQAAQVAQAHQALLCQIEETPGVALQTRAPTAPAPQPAATPPPQAAAVPPPAPALARARAPAPAPARAPAPAPARARVPAPAHAPVPTPSPAPALAPVPAPALSPAPALAPAAAPGQKLKPKPRPRPKGKDLAMTEATGPSKSAPETASGTLSCPGSVVISATSPTGRVEISARSNSNGAAASGSSTMGEVVVSASGSGNVVASVGASIVQDGLSEPRAEAFAEVSQVGNGKPPKRKVASRPPAPTRILRNRGPPS